MYRLIYTGSNGMRYSLTMNEKADYNGDGWTGNSLMYIPTQSEIASMSFADVKDSKGNVTMSADQSRANIEDWIQGNKYAKDHRGQYSDRNCCQAPWENRVDLHLAENIFVPKSLNGSKLASYI
jgi:hypothetical protein